MRELILPMKLAPLYALGLIDLKDVGRGLACVLDNRCQGALEELRTPLQSSYKCHVDSDLRVVQG